MAVKADSCVLLKDATDVRPATCVGDKLASWVTVRAANCVLLRLAI